MSLTRKSVRLACGVAAVLGCGAFEGGGADEMARLLAALALVLPLAKLAGWAFERIKLPAVLGELLAGVLLGNLRHLGFHGLDFIGESVLLQALAELGVIVLLFEVGLESNLEQMMRVGMSALLVAIVGVVTPMALGYAVAAWMLPGSTWHAHLFVGAILSATSVGITVRVLQDLCVVGSVEGRIILGAAVIDDVLALIVLAVVKGLVAGGHTGVGGVLIIVAKAVGFLGGAIAIGGPLARRVFARPRAAAPHLAAALSFCFGAAYLAHVAGLAPIVGAFAAGLVLDRAPEPEHDRLEQLVNPLVLFLVPVFFVVTGAHVDLSVLGDPSILAFAGLLTVAALIGKQACSLAIVEPGLNRLAVGIGMIPRGEVGLIFAAAGASTLLPTGAPVVGPTTYAAVVLMVMVSTLITPPLLSWQIGRGGVRP